MQRRSCLAAAAVLSTLFSAPGTARAEDPLPPVLVNDNRQPAGARSGGSLVLNLRAARGVWHPEGDQGIALTVEALGEESGPLQVPSPLIRVPEGTEVVATIRNDLDDLLQVHGLCARDGSPCATIDVPPASRREVRFPAGRAGTYHYWATTTGMPLFFRAASDTGLGGAFIVDPPGAAADADRVLVITDWTELTREQLRQLLGVDDPGTAFRALDPRFTFVINGLSWPATERFTYQLNDEIRWRVLNLSSQAHPLHLHGFYYEVEARGDGVRDITIDPAARSRVVTQLVQPGGTMAMRWRAERTGNWLFHCHIAEHISPKRQLSAPADAHTGHHDGHGQSAGMAAMVLGVTIVDGDGSAVSPPAAPAPPARAMTLVMQTGPGRYGADPAYGFVLASGEGATPADKLQAPGPTLALKRNEPVEITLVNHLAEATSIHWHGIELESYYDGVHGWSGAGAQVTPLIEPGQSFTVRFTPPHAGTFIYHTHLHDGPQLTSGMYGALLVMEPGETFDPTFDHVVVIGRAGTGTAAPVVLNGEREPSFSWKAAGRHRIRFVNITPNDIFVVSLGNGDGPVTWCPLTKDGAPVSTSQAASRPATTTIAVGETYDFEYDAPPGRQSLWINVRTPAGRWQVQGRVGIK